MYMGDYWLYKVLVIEIWDFDFVVKKVVKCIMFEDLVVFIEVI